MQKSSENIASGSAPRQLLTLSVIVIGRNERDRLGKCLQSVRDARGIVLKELIYVDSASTDGSPEIAAGHGADVLLVHPERPSAATGRNAGWHHATSDLVLFLDGDTVLDPNFPHAAAESLLHDNSIAAVWGHRRELHPERSIYNRVLDLDWVYPDGTSTFCGGDVLMRRSVLAEVDGFDEALIAGEEPELCRRIRACGYTILHIDHPMTLHDLQMTSFRQYWRRARRAGHAFAEVSERFRDSEDALWSADSRGNIIRAVFWVASLTLALASIPWFGLVPLIFWVLLLLLLTVRSGWKARWRNAPWTTLLLYGLHSHLQQVPIFVGQCEYKLGKKRNKRLHLIEYKEIGVGRQPPPSGSIP